MKRQWGLDHILTKKGIAAASADFGLIALAYNLKRIMNLKVAVKNGIKNPLLRPYTIVKAQIMIRTGSVKCSLDNLMKNLFAKPIADFYINHVI